MVSIRHDVEIARALTRMPSFSDIRRIGSGGLGGETGMLN